MALQRRNQPNQPYLLRIPGLHHNLSRGTDACRREPERRDYCRRAGAASAPPPRQPQRLAPGRFSVSRDLGTKGFVRTGCGSSHRSSPPA
jgi:hypothetical protein